MRHCDFLDSTGTVPCHIKHHFAFFIVVLCWESAASIVHTQNMDWTRQKFYVSSGVMGREVCVSCKIPRSLNPFRTTVSHAWKLLKVGEWSQPLSCNQGYQNPIQSLKLRTGGCARPPSGPVAISKTPRKARLSAIRNASSDGHWTQRMHLRDTCHKPA